MKINLIDPHGFCNGVKNTLKIVSNIDKSKYDEPIYLLGNVIHNKIVTNKLIDSGYILLDDKGKTRLELIENIKCGSIIISAHGVGPDVYKKAQANGLKIIDTTCPKIIIIHNTIKKMINDGYEIVYLGTLKHPEVEGVLNIDKKIHFIKDIEDLYSLNLTTNKIYATCQTTLSLYDTENIFNKLKELYPSCIIDNQICKATTLRQKAIIDQPDADLCIIVGDKLSSNSKKLMEISIKKRGINSVLIETLDDAKHIDFTNINTINISSGASTPEEITIEIINYLSSL